MGEVLVAPEFDKPREECGVFGVIGANGATALRGIEQLQHRGQDAAGIALLDGGRIELARGDGLFSDVFPGGTYVPDSEQPNIRKPIDDLLPGSQIAVCHLRYSTDQEQGTQPLEGLGYVLAHNGHITNTEAIREKFGFTSDEYTTDTDCVRRALDDCIGQGMGMVDALKYLLPFVEGAYSFVISDGEKLYGARDANGIRPLCIGRKKNDPTTHFIASETAAFGVVRADFVKEVSSGEIVEIDQEGSIKTYHTGMPVKQKMCGLEYAYFARNDSDVEGVNVYEARWRSGEALAAADRRKHSEALGADFVIGVPDSGTAAAEGYAYELGVAKKSGLVKNPYLPRRTFIIDKQESRENAVLRKFQINKSIIEGKDVVLVDDSLVRGTTMKTLVKLLQEAGVGKIHLRIAFPPMRGACYYGINIPDNTELLAHNRTLEQMREELGVESIEFIEPDDFEGAVGRVGKLCMACVNGEYPTAVPVSIVA